MLISDEGIVLHHLRYGDSSVILHAYCRELGRRAFLVRGVSSKRNKKAAMLQPLSLIAFSSDVKESNSLSSLRSLERSITLQSIPFDVVKGSIALFMADFLHKAIPEHYKNQDLFDFLKPAIEWLDKSEQVHNFHIHFLIQMTRILGYEPQVHVEEPTILHYFDFEHGILSASRPQSVLGIEGEPARLFHRILGMKFDDIMTATFTNQERRTMIQVLVDYHQIQTPTLAKLKSHEVLQTLFS